MRSPDPSTMKWDERGLVTAVAQDVATGAVLMVAHMDREALARTVSTGEAHFRSRSRNALWRKGETSGNVLMVERILVDCDGDAVLLGVRPSGPACHTGEATCFGEAATTLDQIAAVLRERKATRPPGSYTAQLFDAGRPTILRKVGEEAVEVLLAGAQESDAALVSEVADLWFHSLVLLADRGLGPRDILTALSRRRQPE